MWSIGSLTALRAWSLNAHWVDQRALDDVSIEAETCVNCTMSKTSQLTMSVLQGGC
jgi:hypothetical protein